MVPANVRTILFDVGNTLIYVDLASIQGVLELHGVVVPREELARAERLARRAMYRHSDESPEANDRDRFRVFLRSMLEALGVPSGAALERLGDALARSDLWRFVPGSTREDLEKIAQRDLRLGVVSNSDGRVATLLQQVGLADHFGVIVDSFEVGVEKPEPRIFEIALERLGAQAAETIYVGDFYAVDVVGARRAGIRPVLLDSLGSFPNADCPVIRSLGELERFLQVREGC
jgi:putative hydrolase of the HAD superfamily